MNYQEWQAVTKSKVLFVKINKIRMSAVLRYISFRLSRLEPEGFNFRKWVLGLRDWTIKRKHCLNTTVTSRRPWNAWIHTLSPLKSSRIDKISLSSQLTLRTIEIKVTELLFSIRQWLGVNNCRVRFRELFQVIWTNQWIREWQFR
jgi:hypothetical protein